MRASWKRVDACSGKSAGSAAVDRLRLARLSLAKASSSSTRPLRCPCRQTRESREQPRRLLVQGFAPTFAPRHIGRGLPGLLPLGRTAQGCGSFRPWHRPVAWRRAAAAARQGLMQPVRSCGDSVSRGRSLLSGGSSEGWQRNASISECSSRSLASLDRRNSQADLAPRIRLRFGRLSLAEVSSSLTRPLRCPLRQARRRASGRNGYRFSVRSDLLPRRVRLDRHWYGRD